MKCPNCNGESIGKFCPYCGSEMPERKPSIQIEHNKTIINNFSSSQNLTNIFKYACTEMELKNYNNAYRAFSKILEIKPNDYRTLLFRETCAYYVNKDFEKIMNIYLKCISQCKDSISLNDCKFVFFDVLIDYSRSAYSLSQLNVVFSLSNTLIGTKGIDIKEYIKSFQDDVIQYKLCHKNKLTYNDKKQIKQILAFYETLLN